VFGLLKQGDKVYTEIVPDCKGVTLQRIIKGKTGVDSVIQMDGKSIMIWQILAIRSVLGCTMEKMNLPEEALILTV
jgi:multisubunit Na+/H+ antiporter MnhF subunit